LFMENLSLANDVFIELTLFVQNIKHLLELVCHVIISRSRLSRNPTKSFYQFKIQCLHSH
jgi:hypothetical protein